jgi:predicted DNA-binding transcriptional regulator YafY
MAETSGRLFRLLSLLQSSADRSGTVLAERLGVSPRTLRRDVDRLRELGYPVEATAGAAGYRLGAGRALPPLLLDDDEAVAVAVGLRTAASGTVAGIEDSSLGALTKLEQVLPSHLRYRVNTLARALEQAPGGGPRVNVRLLTLVAAACRDHQQLGFTYGGRGARRTVEPLRLVSVNRRWYLLAWDIDKGAWRTFRADRIGSEVRTGRHFTPRPPPAEDLGAYVAAGVGSRAWPYQGRVRCHAPAEVVAARLWTGFGVVEPDGPQRCVLEIGTDSLEMMALVLGVLRVDFEVESPAELIDHVRALAGRYGRAAGEA